ncbi:MAG: Serine phosphatase RsbU subunit sigma [Chlorobi bacterium]|nr:Serine phosphatase RsbU subunit sigma [Chlorobiota bacterium]
MGSIIAGWLGLLIYDIAASGQRGALATHPRLRMIIPLVALIPAALRILRSKDLESNQHAYRVFVRLTVITLVTSVVLGLVTIIPIRLTQLDLPADLLSHIGAGVAGLIVMLGLPLIAENMARLFRYRNRGSASGMSRLYFQGLFLLAVVAQMIPIAQDGKSGIVFTCIAAGFGALGFIMAVQGGWILNLRKRQKLKLLGLAFIGAPAAGTLMGIALTSDAGTGMLTMNPALIPLIWGLGLSAGFVNMIIFVTSLFALPTADAIDRRNIEVSSLANFARLLTQSLDSGNLIDTAIAIACEATSGYAVWLEKRDGEEREILLGSSPRIPQQVALGLMEATVGKRISIRSAVTERRRVEVIDRLTGFAWGGQGGRHEIRSIAAAPMQVGDDLRGTLFVAKERINGFDRDDLVVLTALADQIALAFQQSRLIQQSLQRERLEQEMLIALDLQRRLLPKLLPQSPFFEIHAESVPASIVGGDYYDVVTFSDQTLGIVVADVSGKGASAALYMGMIKGIIQALSGRCSSPKELLAETNVALHGNLDQRWFATMTCAQIVDERRTLRIARAGHCPTLLIRDGSGMYSRSKGLGLAICKPALFDRNLEVEEFVFSPGDYAIFYSDGLPEARATDGEEYGYEKLMETALTAAGIGASPVAMRDAIFEQIDKFCGTEPQADDSTLVILRWQ